MGSRKLFEYLYYNKFIVESDSVFEANIAYEYFEDSTLLTFLFDSKSFLNARTRHDVYVEFYSFIPEFVCNLNAELGFDVNNV